jgi:hypothetical protein
MAVFTAIKIRWSTVVETVAILTRPNGVTEQHTVRYVASAGDEPRLKIISSVPGSIFSPGLSAPIHHLSYWVADLDDATMKLVAGGFEVEATGFEADGSARYRYLVGAGGIRIELGLDRNRAEFDAWANGI